MKNDSCPVLYPLGTVVKCLGVAVSKVKAVTKLPLAYSDLSGDLYRVTLIRKVDGKAHKFNTYWCEAAPDLNEVMAGLSSTHGIFDFSEDLYYDYGFRREDRSAQALMRLLGAENTRLRKFLGQTGYDMLVCHCDKSK